MTTASAAEVIDHYRTALDAVTELNDIDTTRCSEEQLVELTRINEELSRRTEALTVQRFADNLERRPQPMIDSAGTIRSFYEDVLNVGRGEIERRSKHCDALANRISPLGEPLAPKLPDTAQALRRGQLSRTHVDVITKVMRKLPADLDDEIRATAESTLAEFATQLTPRKLEKIGTRLLAYVDPDGQYTSDDDRKARRGLTLSPQDEQLMSQLTADLTPAARATIELALELFSVKGMNNPDDPHSPHGSSTTADPKLLAEAAARDKRTANQRRHDALVAICQFAMTTAAGTTCNGLPAHLIVTASKQDIENGRGFATTSTGSIIPVTDAIDLLVNDPNHTTQAFIVVFDDHTRDVIYFGTGRRAASTYQRYAQFGRDRGCTTPSCEASMLRAQSHHIHRWEYGGRTTISNLGAACGPHNRSEGPGPTQWRTVRITEGPDKGRVGWIDPADPTKTPQVNNAHFPDIQLRHHWAAHHRRNEMRRRAGLGTPKLAPPQPHRRE